MRSLFCVTFNILIMLRIYRTNIRTLSMTQISEWRSPYFFVFKNKHNPLTKCFPLFQFSSTRKVYSLHKDTFEVFQNMIHCIHLSVECTSHHFNFSDVTFISCVSIWAHCILKQYVQVFEMLKYFMLIYWFQQWRTHIKQTNLAQQHVLNIENTSCWHITHIKVISTLIPWHPDHNRVYYIFSCVI
jgi:hypothetical protein